MKRVSGSCYFILEAENGQFMILINPAPVILFLYVKTKRKEDQMCMSSYFIDMRRELGSNSDFAGDMEVGNENICIVRVIGGRRQSRPSRVLSEV